MKTAEEIGDAIAMISRAVDCAKSCQAPVSQYREMELTIAALNWVLDLASPLTTALEGFRKTFDKMDSQHRHN